MRSRPLEYTDAQRRAGAGDAKRRLTRLDTGKRPAAPPSCPRSVLPCRRRPRRRPREGRRPMAVAYGAVAVDHSAGAVEHLSGLPRPAPRWRPLLYRLRDEAAGGRPGGHRAQGRDHAVRRPRRVARRSAKDTDPEDVDAALRAYYSLVRSIVERFGGVVEKFIGDAVVGLFGVPLAPRTTPTAVRAALEVVARMRELPPAGEDALQVRCAVNTGPALVRLTPTPKPGRACSSATQSTRAPGCSPSRRRWQ